MRFLGNIEAHIDAKGRAFMPAVFRKELQSHGEETLVLRKDAFTDCLVLYPGSVWEREVDALRARLSLWNARHKQVLRQFLSEVMELSLDGNGRFLIPKAFLEKAHITQGIRFIGIDDTIELWSADRAEPFMGAKEFSAALEEFMGQRPTSREPAEEESR